MPRPGNTVPTYVVCGSVHRNTRVGTWTARFRLTGQSRTRPRDARVSAGQVDTRGSARRLPGDAEYSLYFGIIGQVAGDAGVQPLVPGLPRPGQRSGVSVEGDVASRLLAEARRTGGHGGLAGMAVTGLT